MSWLFATKAYPGVPVQAELKTTEILEQAGVLPNNVTGDHHFIAETGQQRGCNFGLQCWLAWQTDSACCGPQLTSFHTLRTRYLSFCTYRCSLWLQTLLICLCGAWHNLPRSTGLIGSYIQSLQGHKFMATWLVMMAACPSCTVWPANCSQCSTRQVTDHLDLFPGEATFFIKWHIAVWAI